MKERNDRKQNNKKCTEIIYTEGKEYRRKPKQGKLMAENRKGKRCCQQKVLRRRNKSTKEENK